MGIQGKSRCVFKSIKYISNVRICDKATKEEEIPKLRDEVKDKPPTGFEDIPIMKVSKEDNKRMRRPWHQSLVIRLLVQTIGYNLPYKKLLQIWSPKVELVAIDLANDFFITKFSLPKDYQFVLREGSWTSFDHFLVIRR
ncbi:hypothetical protein BT93_C0766 [Corymbia citriodora subsp. variegata]|nr:hypothetical protein BT93_C0766 [Corymbia citriodora subsp. variegata]